MLRVEFHCHTYHSKDSLSTPEQLLSACRKRGIDRLVITDHNQISGALEAHKIDPRMVIVGEEVMTLQGELLAAFVQELIPPGLPAKEAIRLLREQGAFISVSHPFDRAREGAWQEQDLLEVLSLVDAVETFNARAMWPFCNNKARAFANQHSLLWTVGSDAHTPGEVGRATLLIPEFHDSNSLREALATAKARCILSPPWVHFYSRYAARHKERNTHANTT